MNETQEKLFKELQELKSQIKAKESHNENQTIFTIEFNSETESVEMEFYSKGSYGKHMKNPPVKVSIKNKEDLEEAKKLILSRLTCQICRKAQIPYRIIDFYGVIEFVCCPECLTEWQKRID